jgi:hypothetical protein
MAAEKKNEDNWPVGCLELKLWRLAELELEKHTSFRLSGDVRAS